MFLLSVNYFHVRLYTYCILVNAIQTQILIFIPYTNKKVDYKQYALSALYNELQKDTSLKKYPFNYCPILSKSQTNKLTHT